MEQIVTESWTAPAWLRFMHEVDYGAGWLHEHYVQVGVGSRLYRVVSVEPPALGSFPDVVRGRHRTDAFHHRHRPAGSSVCPSLTITAVRKSEADRRRRVFSVVWVGKTVRCFRGRGVCHEIGPQLVELN